MDANKEVIRKPHLSKEQRLPRTYKDVLKILKTVKNCEANIKTAVHNAKLPSKVIGRIYSLTVNILRQSQLLEAVIQETKLLEKEPFLRREVAELLIYELIFGKGLQGESKQVMTLKKYEYEIETAYNNLKDKLAVNGPFISIPKYVRINTLITTIEEVLQDLEYVGLQQIFYEETISETGYYDLVKNLKCGSFLIDYHFKDLLVFPNEENLSSWSLYQSGYVFIQDKSSYIPAHVLNPEPGSTVLDACAAPGMKTLHLTALMQNKGVLYAFERDEIRFKTLESMLQSGQANICQTHCEDFNLVDVNDEKFSSVEYILLDPSCSGSGMVSRMDSVTDTEESKNSIRIQKLAGFQIVLLKHALAFPSVKRVVYSTCSITETENEYVVHEALSHFSQKFKLTKVLPDWPIRGSDKYEFGPLCLRAYPEKCLTNGFFVAMFERVEFPDQQISYSYKKKTQRRKNELNDSDEALQQGNHYLKSYDNPLDSEEKWDFNSKKNSVSWNHKNNDLSAKQKDLCSKKSYGNSKNQMFDQSSFGMNHSNRHHEETKSQKKRKRKHENDYEADTEQNLFYSDKINTLSENPCSLQIHTVQGEKSKNELESKENSCDASQQLKNKKRRKKHSKDDKTLDSIEESIKVIPYIKSNSKQPNLSENSTHSFEPEKEHHKYKIGYDSLPVEVDDINQDFYHKKEKKKKSKSTDLQDSKVDLYSIEKSDEVVIKKHKKKHKNKHRHSEE